MNLTNHSLITKLRIFLDLLIFLNSNIFIFTLSFCRFNLCHLYIFLTCNCFHIIYFIILGIIHLLNLFIIIYWKAFGNYFIRASLNNHLRCFLLLLLYFINIRLLLYWIGHWHFWLRRRLSTFLDILIK